MTKAKENTKEDLETKLALLESTNKFIEEVRDWYTPPHEERRQPLLDALKECWDLAPSMRFTQLLINAKVFPHHLNDNWGVYDEETTKKLKKFTRELKREKKERNVLEEGEESGCEAV
jgi:hypothetical protein